VDGNRFDNVARSLARARNRRGLVLAVATGVASLGASLLRGPDAGEAARRPKPTRTPRPTEPPRRRRCRYERTCRAGEICRNGYCFSCWPEKIPCDNVCVDPLRDPSNCGDCNIVCAEDEVCGDGCCGSPCVDNLDCPDNVDFHCELGICSSNDQGPRGCCVLPVDCLPDQPDCCKTADSIFCVDFRTDPKHCGRCGNDCGEAGCCGGMCCT
jgi:hypothetical protein